MLWGIKNKFNLSLKEAEHTPVTSIPRRSDYLPVKVDSRMEDLVDRAMKQNFVPVVDDQKNFIGIITRKEIIRYFYNRMCREDSAQEKGIARYVIQGEAAR